MISSAAAFAHPGGERLVMEAVSAAWRELRSRCPRREFVWSWLSSPRKLGSTSISWRAPAIFDDLPIARLPRSRSGSGFGAIRRRDTGDPTEPYIGLKIEFDTYTEGLVECLAEYCSTARYMLYVLGHYEFYGTGDRRGESAARRGMRRRPGSICSTRKWCGSTAPGSSERRSGPTACSRAGRTRSGRTCA